MIELPTFIDYLIFACLLAFPAFGIYMELRNGVSEQDADSWFPFLEIPFLTWKWSWFGINLALIFSLLIAAVNINIGFNALYCLILLPLSLLRSIYLRFYIFSENPKPLTMWLNRKRIIGKTGKAIKSFKRHETGFVVLDDKRFDGQEIQCVADEDITINQPIIVEGGTLDFVKVRPTGRS